MGWRVAVAAALLCGVSHGRPSLLGAALGDHEGGHHEDHQVSQTVDYSDYDYQPSGRDLSAGDDYYSDYTPSAAYAFQFNEDGQSRQEEQDDAGLVTGSYSYTGEDGAEHTVTYRAGAGIGFQIIDPEVKQMFESFGEKAADTLPEAATRDTATAPDTLYGAPAEELPEVVEAAPDTLYGAPAEEVPAYAEAPLPAYTETAAPAMMMMDPSYFFQYSGPDSQRTEDADSRGAVVGSYGYNTPGGQHILVRYTAGAETGFVIENQQELDAALAKAASEPFVSQAAEPPKERKIMKVRKPAKAGGRQEEHVFTLQEEEPTPLAGAPPAPATLASAQQLPKVALDTLYGAPAEDLPSYEEAPQPSYREEEEEAEATTMSMMMDPSYNFGYTGAAGSREEAADTRGDVTGQYSYTSPEGQEILVRYRAGADIGFVIENQEELAASVRAATDAGAEAAAARAAEETLDASSDNADAVVISIPNMLYGAPSAPEADSEPLPSYSEPLPSYSETEPTPTTMVMDASFNFAVKEADHSFQEEADRAGERRGSYSFLTPEGRMVEVRYTAGRDGFVILNPEDVLPQP